MRRSLSILALAATASVAPSGQETPQQQPPPPVFRTEANYVRVDAFPTKDGRPVHGLTAQDFEILEDGVPQKIASFEHVVINVGTPPDARIEPNSVREGERMAANPRNRVFVVFLDVPHVQVTSSHAIKEPLIALLGRTMGPDDLVAVMTPLMSPTQMTFGRKTDVIERGLRENWPWGHRDKLQEMDEVEHQYQMCYPGEPGEGAVSGLARELIARRRERLVLDSFRDMLGYLGGVREERKAVVLVTEGWRLHRPSQAVTTLRQGEPVPGKEPIGVGPDGRLRRDPENMRTRNVSSKYECDADRLMLSAIDNEQYFRDILELANRTNTSFYPVDPRGLPASDDVIGVEPLRSPAGSQSQLRDKLTRLRELAENTDGLAILDSNDLHKGMKRISDDLTSYYLIGYYSSNTKLDGGFRSVKVNVRAPGVAVRARRGYRAASADAVNAARAAAAAPIPPDAVAVGEAIAELSRVRPDIPFVIRAVPDAEPGARTLSAIWVAGELQGGRDAPGGGAATVEVTGTGATVTANATLAPGERAFLVRVPLQTKLQHADVRARFTPTSSPLAMTYTARVKAPSGLADPVMFRRGQATGNRLQPVAGFVFTRAERVRLETPLNAGDTPGTGRLLDKAGQPLQIPVAISERTDAATGRRWLVADVTLAALAAGDYGIEMTAKSGGVEQKVVTAIRVTR